MSRQDQARPNIIVRFFAWLLRPVLEYHLSQSKTISLRFEGGDRQPAIGAELRRHISQKVYGLKD